MRKTVQMWRTADYWQDRAARALANAKYKQRPEVRHRRSEGLDADLRRHDGEQKHVREREDGAPTRRVRP